MRKHILVVGGNDSSAVKAAQLDADVSLFQLPRLLTQAQIAAARRVFVFDFEQQQETNAFARTLHETQHLQAVVSFWERALLPTAIIGEALGLAANPVRPVRLTRDKLGMRKLLAAKHLDDVRFRECLSPDDLAAFLTRLRRAVVLKPTDGSGSSGVSLVSTQEDVARAWEWAARTGSSSFIAEEYIQGPEYSVESISLNGQHQILGITEKFTTGAPHFIEVGHRFPASLSANTARRIYDTVVGLLTCVGHSVGPAHTEVRLRGDMPVIIETQTRFGGDQIWEIVELVTGVDLTKTTVAHLLQLTPPAIAPKAGGAAIRFFTYENCCIGEVKGVHEAQNLPGVVRIECKLHSGEELGPLRESKERQGYVLAMATSSEEAWMLATRALSEIQVEVRPAGRASHTNGAAILPVKTAAASRLQRLIEGVRQDEMSIESMLSLTANENLPSRLCRSLFTSSLADHYHLGAAFERLPSNYLVKGGLMLKGLPQVCALEHAAEQAAREMFDAEVSDFRPLSGVHATLCTLSLATRPGDIVYSISPAHGGHFATRVLLEHIGRRSRYLPWDNASLTWDRASLAKAFRKSPPAAVLLDLGVVLKPLPVRALRELTGPRVCIIYDASHTLGLIAGKVFPNPLTEGCDVLQGNTHKTFPGPQKGMLHFRQQRFGNALCSKLSEGFVSSQHTHHAVALYVAMLEMQTFGRDYARQMVANAQALARALEVRGFELFRVDNVPTLSNTVLITATRGPDVYLACELLLRCGISTNARPFHGRGVLRIGTQQITRLGMREPEMEWIAEMFHRSLVRREPEEPLRHEVKAFVSRYRNVHYSFDQAIGMC
jgi:glycine hydroxymethyltransferase